MRTAQVTLADQFTQLEQQIKSCVDALAEQRVVAFPHDRQLSLAQKRVKKAIDKQRVDMAEGFKKSAYGAVGSLAKGMKLKEYLIPGAVKNREELINGAMLVAVDAKTLFKFRECQSSISSRAVKKQKEGDKKLQNIEKKIRDINDHFSRISVLDLPAEASKAQIKEHIKLLKGAKKNYNSLKKDVDVQFQNLNNIEAKYFLEGMSGRKTALAEKKKEIEQSIQKISDRKGDAKVKLEARHRIDMIDAQQEALTMRREHEAQGQLHNSRVTGFVSRVWQSLRG